MPERHRFRPRPRKIRKRIIVLLLLLIGGAIVNVAVAWGCARFIDVAEADEIGGIYIDSVRGEWQLSRWDSLGSTLIHAYYEPSLDSSSRIEIESAELWDFIPWWIPERQDRFERFGAVVDDKCKYLAEARGFPLRSLRQEYEMRHLPGNPLVLNIEWTVHGGIPFEYGRYTPRSLPLRPIWSGIAINTVFYAAILWLLFLAPLQVRRSVRIKRGLCPMCAYDLRGSESSVCPECGWERAS